MAEAIEANRDALEPGPPLGWLNEVRCQRCRDHEFVAGELLPGPEPRFHRRLPCPECMTQARLLALNGVPPRLQSTTLEQMQRLPGKEAALALVGTWDMRTSLVLHSMPGTENATWGAGKSQVAALLLHKAVSAGWPGAWISAVGLLDSIKSTFDSRDTSTSEMIRHWSSQPLLVIDDLGAERDTDWVIEQLRRLIEERDAGMHTTIITTNAYGADHLERKLGSAGGAVVSRLKRAIWVPMGGQDMRGATE